MKKEGCNCRNCDLYGLVKKTKSERWYNDLEWADMNWENFAKHYLNKHLLIRNKHIEEIFDTPEEAYKNNSENYGSWDDCVEIHARDWNKIGLARAIICDIEKWLSTFEEGKKILNTIDEEAEDTGDDMTDDLEKIIYERLINSKSRGEVIYRRGFYKFFGELRKNVSAKT